MGKQVMAALALAFAAWLCPQPEAKAFVDPVTISLMAPIALEAARIAAPYMIRGLKSGGSVCLKMCGDVVDVFKLPLGVCEMTLGTPFGFFSDGLRNCLVGLVAPFRLGWHTAALPVSLFAGGFIR